MEQYEVTNLLKNHRSIRKFTEEKLSDETIKLLVKAAQSASTSSYAQTYTIIGVTNSEKKKALKEVSTQHYVEDNGHLFVFIVDYRRHKDLSIEKDAPIDFHSTEQFIVGTVDASLAAQNLAISAESIGLGICYIGSLRNDTAKVLEILELPQGTFPLFGMATGYPAHEGSVKERLPLEVVYHENTYKNLDATKEDIEKYDERIRKYYKERTKGKREEAWSDQVIGMLNNKQRFDVDDIVKKQGFLGQ